MIIKIKDKYRLPVADVKYDVSKNWWVDLLFISILIISFLYFIPIRYQSNDDVAMLSIVSGAYTGSSDSHLVFIHKYIGHLLAAMYREIEGIEFYTIFFIFVHIISFATISNFIRSQALKVELLIPIYFLALASQLSILIKLQFTTTSAILACASIILMRKSTIIPVIFGCIFFVISAAIRFESALLILLISIPFLCEKNILKTIKIVFIFFLLLFAIKSSNDMFYRNSDSWEGHKSYFDLRMKINDNSNQHHFEPRSSQEKNDYELLIGFFPNPAAFSADRLREIKVELQAVPLVHKIDNISSAVYPYLKQIAFIFYIFTICFIFCHEVKYQIALMLLIFSAFLCYIPLDGILKTRAFYSAMLPLLTVALPLCAKQLSFKLAERLIILPMVIVAMFIIASLKADIDSVQYKTKVINEQLALSKEVYMKHRKPIFSLALSVEFLSPFDISRQLKNIQLIYGGWLMKAPFPNQINSYEDLLSKSIFISKEQMHLLLPKMKQSILDNHRMVVDHQVLAESDRYAIIEFKRR